MEISNQSNDTVSRAAEDNLLSQSHSPLNNSSGEDISTYKHPLLISVVVDLIVKHLDPDFEQLKTLRLISTVWTQATHLRWRNSCGVLTIVPDPPNFSKSRHETGVSVSNFLEEFDNPESPFQLSQKPHSKYKLKDFTLDLELCAGVGDGGGGPDTSAYRFWNTIGPLMKSVHLYKCLFVGQPADGSHSSAICPRVQFLARMIPNLKDLVLTDMTTPEARKYWENETLDDDFDAILDLTLVGKGSPYLNLSTLTIYGDLKKNMSLGQLLMLAPWLEVRFRNIIGNLLISLCLQPFYHDAEDEFGAYLKSFSTTLKTFKGFRAPVGPPFSDFLDNASMGQLTELHSMGAITEQFEFLRNTPNLRKLKIDLGCFEKTDQIKKLIEDHNAVSAHKWKFRKYQDDMVMEVAEGLKDGILCTKLEHLEIDFEFPEESLRLLGKWMPNLKTLKTILNIGTVPVVCEIWSELNELVCMYGSKIENYCFFGSEEEADFGGNPSEMKICDLKDLERFQLDAYYHDCNLTGDVVHKGFLKMPGLKCVEICVNFQMSAEAEEALRKGIQFCKVVRDDHDGCGSSALLGTSSFLCDRCGFRNEVIYGIGRKDQVGDSTKSEDSEEEESDDGSIIGLGLGPQSVDSDEDSRSSDGKSSAGTVEGDPVHYM